MLNKILKRKWLIFFIFINMLIFCSYFILLSKSGFHGADDFNAVTSKYNPDITFTEKIHQICDRTKYWNARIGETLCFSIGALPVNLIFFITSSIMLVLVNLITYFTIGKEKYKNMERTGICNLVIYIIFLVIYPATAEVFFWYSAFCSHVIAMVIFLIILIPYRNILDGEDCLNKFNFKYLLYILLCLCSGFNSEAVVLNTIFIISLYNVYYIIKNKKISIIKLLPLIAILISFVIYFFVSQNRINFFEEHPELYNDRSRILMFFDNRLIQILLLIILTILYMYIYKFNDFCSFKKIIFMFVLSSFSLVCICFAPYYSNRRYNNV